MKIVKIKIACFIVFILTKIRNRYVNKIEKDREKCNANALKDYRIVFALGDIILKFKDKIKEIKACVQKMKQKE